MTVINAERTMETDQTAQAAAAVEQVEGEIRAFVRRDLSAFRRARQDKSELDADNIDTVIERVSGAAIAEIERVMAELATVRNMLRNEAERVRREVAGYASLNQAAMTSMKIIADSLGQWKSHGKLSEPNPAQRAD